MRSQGSDDDPPHPDQVVSVAHHVDRRSHEVFGSGPMKTKDGNQVLKGNAGLDDVITRSDDLSRGVERAGPCREEKRPGRGDSPIVVADTGEQDATLTLADIFHPPSLPQPPLRPRPAGPPSGWQPTVHYTFDAGIAPHDVQDAAQPRRSPKHRALRPRPGIARRYATYVMATFLADASMTSIGSSAADDIGQFGVIGRVLVTALSISLGSRSVGDRDLAGQARPDS